MSNWSAGYVADIGYTFGYYTELNPLRIKLAFLNRGLVFPKVGSACELGFGQGISTNMHAAASITEWWGTDFNPAQASFAQDLAAAGELRAHLYDEAFSDFTSRDDLPDFDFIGLHGIWSWISDDNRTAIVDFMRRKLKVGGVLYISYNTMPGWAAFAPMRHLMTEHAEVIGSAGRGIVSRVDDAIVFAEKLLAANPAFSRTNPSVGDRVSKLKDQNRHYLAHEYFNRDWHPMHFATMADWLEPAKLSFACSANYLDAIDGVNLTEEQQKFLKEIPDEMFKESVRDFMVNQQFRRDYWVKGKRTMSRHEQLAATRLQRVILVTPREDVSLKVTGSLGEATMSEAVYEPILDYLADHGIKTIEQIEQSMVEHKINFAQVSEAVLVLSAAGHLAAAQDEHIIEQTKKQTDKLNRYVCSRALGSGDMAHLASPVTGGALSVSRFNQVFLLAIAGGETEPRRWAQICWDALAAQGEAILKDGKPLASSEENLNELIQQAERFADKYLPVLKAVQIA